MQFWFYSNLGNSVLLKRKQINIGDIIVPANGYFAFQDKIESEIRSKALFSTIYSFGSATSNEKNGTSFSICTFYIISEPNTSITNLKIDLWYM